MSNDVVISKELRDRILGLLSILPVKGPATDGYAAELRAAPETVSLEGVERWSEGASDFGLYRSFDGDWVGFSDLRRLITPVQPSAVVSREYYRGPTELSPIQFPQPVAPVQPSAVVTREDFEKWLANKNTATNGERFWAREVFGFLTHGGKYD